MTEVSSQNSSSALPVSGIDTPMATRPASLTAKQARTTTAAEPMDLKSPRPRRRGFRIDPGEDESPTWQQNLIRSIASALGVGFGASMIVHTAAIVVFGFWILDFEKLLPDFVLNAGAEKAGIEVELDTDLPIDLAQKKAGPELSEPKLLIASEVVTRNLNVDANIPTDLENRINQLAEKDAKEDKPKDEDSENSKGAVPKGGARIGKNAVTKGRFTVWSIPANPNVRQSYRIVIRVQLPPDVKRFRIDDLTGTVHGDLDLHEQQIPHDPKWGPPKVRAHGRYIPLNKEGYVPVRSHKGKKFAVIYIWVPGSLVPKTTDTVKIRSKMLKEEQRLKIVF